MAGRAHRAAARQGMRPRLADCEGSGEERAAAAARAMDAFLDAVVPSSARNAVDLRGTPGRVAEAWLEELLDGYGQDPADILAEAMPAAGKDLVALTGIDFHSMCPHHLLPSRGVAHVAYLPAGKVVGLGQIARLVDCFAHRLVLEEDLARQIAQALMKGLGARGAACILDAEQACLSTRGERRRHARAHAQCFLGVLDSDPGLQARVLALARPGRNRPRRSQKRRRGP